ncbi:MAG: hypothetical protein H7321_02520 [Bacteroidia bacterium]|nr:hypothetical protein [Bacteroidia bacterium]
MKTEITFICACILSVLLRILNVPYANILILISLASLALIYFPGGTYFFSGETIRDQNIQFSLITGLNLSVVIIAVLFWILNWQGAKFISMIAVPCPVILFGVATYLRIKKKPELNIYYCRMQIRTGFYFLLTLICFSFTVLKPSKKINSITFVEPGVSFEYDSSLFNLKKKFTASHVEEEAQFLTYKPNNAFISIQGQYSKIIPSQSAIDSLLQTSLNGVNKFENDSVKIVGKAAEIHYKDFTGFGFTATYKKRKQYALSFMVTRFFNGGFCTIFYNASSASMPDYNEGREILINILDGIKTHNRKEIDASDSILKSMYTITIDSTRKPAEMESSYTRSFYGNLHIQPALKVEKIYIKNGETINISQGKSSVFKIYCNDASKGLQEKTGTINVIDKFGRNAMIPFSFQYYNH